MSSPHTIILRAQGRIVLVAHSHELLAIVARSEYETEHTLWSFLGCSRESRIPVVKVNVWTLKGLTTCTIDVGGDENVASHVLEELVDQIPADLNPDIDEDELEQKEAEIEAQAAKPEPVSESDEYSTEDEEEEDEEEDKAEEGEVRNSA